MKSSIARAKSTEAVICERLEGRTLLAGTVNQPGDLVGGVDPYNMGKGEWIWQIPSAYTNTGTSNLTDLAKFLKAKGVKWVIVKAGDANNGPVTGTWGTNFNKTVVDTFHAQGLKIFGYHFTYGGVFPNGKNATTTLSGEKKVADEIMSFKPDGLIIDAEGDWERNPNANRDAEDYAKTFKQKYPRKLLGHAPFPYVRFHRAFPYLGFGKWVDVVMPQLYWKTISIAQSPEVILRDVNQDYKELYNEFAAQGYPEAIKPIVPIAQGYDPSATKKTPGAEVTRFMDLLRKDLDPAGPFGYNGVSFWSVQHHTPEIWSAVGNGVSGAASGSISGQLFNDLDGDALRDVGEVGLAGHIIWDDTDSDGKRDGYEPFDTTDSNGNYTLLYRAAGTHRLRQELPKRWRQSLPTRLSAGTVELTSGEKKINVDFGATQMGLITGAVFYDADADGLRDSRETILANRRVFLDTNLNGRLDAGEKNTLTSATGIYSFTVPQGSYRVVELPGAGERNTGPTRGFYDLAMARGDAASRSFGNTRKTWVGGFVYNDLDGDGRKETGEAGLKSWRVFVDFDADRIWDQATEPSALTDSLGYYVLQAVDGGTWRFQTFVQQGWKATVPGGAARGLALADAQIFTKNNFGVRAIT